MGDGYTVQTSRILDGAIMTMFTMIVSAFFLYMFKALWFLLNRSEFKWFKVGLIITTIFPFKHSFDYNLTHIFLFSICTLIFCVKPVDEESGAKKEGFDFKKMVPDKFKKYT
ncbi:antigen UB05 [Babesia microti strain RI]|uniref:Antigen UB05 n=1 Tax=Babesia microti (strain RI) TaxID=1133968 RepID=A0A1R4AB40_BABMR|nr:antigen UB05 [Babesia microti strain RI]SJK86229.1 antigen UB05 [Babesia microti strain RI]|eukprot:XP_021338412.1 antigen UB05 [Babesia microti strain RI]